MDIVNFEREKAISRCLMRSIPLRIAGLDSASCYRYLISYPNSEIVELISIAYEAANHITNYWQKELIKNMVGIGLTICCKDEKYSKVLSKILTQIYDRNIEIEKYKSFNIAEKAMMKILLETSDKILKQRTYILDEVHNLLSDCGNDTISFIYSITSKAMREELSENDYNRVSKIFEFILYMAYLDTAYRDPFFWILNKFARKEICNAIKKLVKKPYDWYVNVWMRSKKLTGQLQKKGAIPSYEHSIVERRMCPAKQTYDLKKGLGR